MKTKTSKVLAAAGIGVAVMAGLPSAKAGFAAEDAAKVNTWKWGLWEIESYDARGEIKKAPQASVAEASGKGAPLILEQCQARYLSLVDHDEDLWGTSGHYQVAWIRWENDRSEPVLATPGQDGWYFDIDTSANGRFGGILKAGSFAICPSKEGDNARCRTFTTHNMNRAVSFVCQAKGESPGRQQ